MTGALLAMPLLIINMGGEMVYILQQRLTAQNIDSSKSVKVLADVLKTMYSSRFVQELFKPQLMYSNQATRQIFDRLAHSSIMRLNQSSMDKLYDLMSMGFKYQILQCTSPKQLVMVTMNHLQSLKKMVAKEEIHLLLNSAVQLTVETYGNLSLGTFIIIKQHLCRFFQDRRVKVSLFLQNESQNSDGNFVLNNSGLMIQGADIPGTVRYYDANEKETTSDMLEINSANGAIVSSMDHILDCDPETCTQGENIYCKEANSNKKSPSEIAADAKCANPKAPVSPSKKQHKASASDGLNLLADLLGSSTSLEEKDNSSSSFKINLFPNDSQFDSKGDETYVNTIIIDGSSDRKNVHSMADDLDIDAKAQDKESDDLLSLMDSAKD